MSRNPNNKRRTWSVFGFCLAINFAFQTCAIVGAQEASLSADTTIDDGQASRASGYRGVLVASPQVTKAKLSDWREQGIRAIALLLDDAARPQEAAWREAAELISAEDFQLDYWIDVGRCKPLAEEHPEWMASLQTHDEWRRLFPDVRQPNADEVAKTYPWVPILAREPFAAQLQRVKRILQGLPAPSRVYLNHLQGGPSACGCGNTLCRWTSDYGKKRVTTPLGDDAAALFVQAIGRLSNQAEIIPVWTTECEEHDGAPNGQCAGVGCFNGICWKAWARLFAPISDECPTIAALTLYKAMHRDDPHYGSQAAWIGTVVDLFSQMPLKHGQQPVEPTRLIVVLQGWDVTDQEIQAQVEVAKAAKAGGYIIDYAGLDQSWQPKIMNWRQTKE